MKVSSAHACARARVCVSKKHTGVTLSELNGDSGCFPSRMLGEMEIEGSEQGRDKSEASQRAEGTG